MPACRKERQSAALLEMTGLLPTLEGSSAEAGDFFQMRRSSPKPADQLRCKLYDAELAIRKAIPTRPPVAANHHLRAKFSQLPALAAAIDLKKSSQ